MRPWECSQTDTLTEANWLYNLPHAIYAIVMGQIIRASFQCRPQQAVLGAQSTGYGRVICMMVGRHDGRTMTSYTDRCGCRCAAEFWRHRDAASLWRHSPQTGCRPPCWRSRSRDDRRYAEAYRWRPGRRCRRFPPAARCANRGYKTTGEPGPGRLVYGPVYLVNSFAMLHLHPQAQSITDIVLVISSLLEHSGLCYRAKYYTVSNSIGLLWLTHYNCVHNKTNKQTTGKY